MRSIRRKSVLSSLAREVYQILGQRASLSEPRITYAELAAQLRMIDDAFEFINHRSQQLYAALGEVGRECRRLGLPSLPALVVRADTKRPGAAYFEGKCSRQAYRGERINAWRKEVEAVKQTRYPTHF